ncbi:putative NBD/HSP70 family sugar kinase [Stackebrandtia endophytica]|uniref:Putative NBD/HSP70 family sugar kinase n=1 Tax=Stackebrandtia endophytica TaxID=1496996 RepID=A0A543ARM4_9ACTN|nr:ROK family transcriptional regulator [Stackebrandtia endophytica]TQL75186.1 putative NBD/HSP70 family sugar kinase [Stackebrandtia endophytica]
MSVNPASPAMARAINDRMALDLLFEHKKLSAPQLRELTGLSRPSIADLLERLQENELIQIVGESGRKRRGPNAKLYGLVADRAYLAGVDIRRDEVEVALADLAGDTAATVHRPINPKQRLSDVIRRSVVAAAEQADIDASKLHTVVIGAPGAVDQATGELGPGYAFPSWDAEFLPELVDALNVPIVLENEVNLAGVVELRHGAAQGRQDLVVLWLDRSVGASVILDGRLRQGATGAAGEVSKLALPGAPPPIAGKAAGGFHSLVSTGAVRELAVEHDLTGKDIGGVVTEAARESSAGETDFLAALADRIALGALALVATIDPGLIVLAGEIGVAGGEQLSDAVEQRLGTMTSIPVEVRPTALSEAPIVTGALLTALSIAHDDIYGGAAALDLYES